MNKTKILPYEYGYSFACNKEESGGCKWTVTIVMAFIVFFLSTHVLADDICFPPHKLKDESTSFLDEKVKAEGEPVVNIIKNMVPMDFRFKIKQYRVLGGCSQTSESTFVKLMYGIDISAMKIYSLSKKLVTKAPSGRTEGEVLFSLIDNYGINSDSSGYKLLVNGEPLDDHWEDNYKYVKGILSNNKRLTKYDVNLLLDSMYGSTSDAAIDKVIKNMNINQPALVSISGQNTIPLLPSSGHMLTIVKSSDTEFVLINNRETSGPYLIDDLNKVLAKDSGFKNNDKFKVESIITSTKII
ncbi:TPA: hypothetical protein RQK66_002264 [Vibrio vulnificus]|nr:hypothetical protein [Vibrio vulnificus]HDY8158673.1 hypothetical protein [Vibrio vulnificus]